MKFIGQYIQSFIARFRNDVYLEDVSTGTIASGGNLGLDSNNKIVKATEATGDITSVAVTAADENTYTASSGVANFIIGGGAGIDTTLAGSTVTITGETASASNAGIVELATTAETTTGTDTTRAVTPDGLKDGYQGSSNVTTLGTIGTGTWQGTAIASGYLDSDTAHLSGTQTFSGVKTFGIGGIFNKGIVSEGNRASMLNDGTAIHVDAQDVTDESTSASGTAASFRQVSIERPRLMATNSSVTTTDASTLYISNSPLASTNQTITNAWSLWVDAGNARFDGSIYSGSTEAVNSSGLLTVANQSNITGVGTISSGTWQGTAIAHAYIGTDAIETDNIADAQVTVAKLHADAIQTSGETFADNDTSLMTSAAIDDKINTKYAYSYMTWSASAKPSRDGSNNPEWMVPNSAKGIYEEDWNLDTGITSTTTGTTTYAFSRYTAANSLILPHAGVLVGFHAIGRNDDSDLTFKAGLFHADNGLGGAGADGSAGEGIDYGNTAAANEYTLRCVATAAEAEASGGTDGTTNHSFKGPCKLISNTANLTVQAGDALIPAIMGNSSNSTDEIFVTMTIILKIPLTT